MDKVLAEALVLEWLDTLSVDDELRFWGELFKALPVKTTPQDKESDHLEYSHS